MFLCEFREIFKNSFFYRTLPVAAPDQYRFRFTNEDMSMIEFITTNKVFPELLKFLFCLKIFYPRKWKR